MGDSVLDTTSNELKTNAITKEKKKGRKIVKFGRKPDRQEVRRQKEASEVNKRAADKDTVLTATDNPKPFIGPNGKRAKDRRFESRANAVFTHKGKGVFANQRDYLDYTEELNDVLSESLKPNVVDGFATGHPVTQDFSSILTVSGYYSNPTNIPPKDNSTVLRDKGVNVDGFENKEAESVFGMIFELLMEERDDEVNVRVAKVSSTSIPFFTNDAAFKRELMSFVNDNSARIRELIMREDMEGLSRLHIWFAYILQIRLQAEGGTKENGKWKPKDRPVHLWNGQEVISDKTSELEAEGIHNHWSNRVRTVFATSASIGYILTTLLTPRRKAGLHRFAFSLHHTGALDLYRKMRAFGTKQVIGIDVKQMDNNFPGFALDKICDLHDLYYDESVGKMLKWLCHAPFYSAAPGPSYDGGWRGNPFDTDTFDMNYGLPSGIPDVSNRGKVWVIFSLMWDLQRVTGKLWDVDASDAEIKAAIAKVLSGKHEFIAIFNTGDDTVLLLNDISVEYEQEFKDFLDRKLDIKPEHALYERDASVSYLGLVFMKDSMGSIIVPRPNAITYVNKPLAPERSAFDKQRQYWGAGMLERNKYYADMGDTKELIDYETRRIWAKHMSIPDPLQLASAHAQSNPFPHFSGNQASFEVLDDPSKLHYKYDETQIDPEVLESISLSYKQQDLSQIYSIFEK